MGAPVVETRQGSLEGRERRGAALFAGIPYATAPVGSRRFRAPGPPEPWKGLRQAKSFGPVSWQSQHSIGGFLAMGEMACDEDCLRLNVLTPACDDRRRPVMVWIHGGGFTSGSGSIPWYDGTSFVNRGDVVVVTINYRLGALGFLHLAEVGGADHVSSGLNGILDQVAALEWVRDNIAAFGGDPGNVTVFGESAGAMSIGTLLGLPAARGLFHKAIAQSGAAHNTLEPATAVQVTSAFMSVLGASTLEDLVSADPEDLIRAQDELSTRALADPALLGGQGGLALAMPFQPVLDGAALPRQPLQAIREGSASDVALMTGTTLDEWNLFHLMSPGGLDDPRLVQRLDRRFSTASRGGGRHIADTYRVARPGASPDEVWCAVLTDTIFRVPAIRLAEAQLAHQSAHTFLYLFTWASRAFDGRLGSCHALDVPFTFNVLDRPGVELFLGEGGAPLHLAEALHDAWWHFAHTGDPNHPNLPTWPAYELTLRPTLAFGERIEVLHDPASAERALWEGL